MPVARWHGKDYHLVNVTDHGEYVLRDAAGDVFRTTGVERIG